MKYFLLIILVLLRPCRGLDLDKLQSLGISGDFYISDIVVHFNRAFLAIPRDVCNNNATHPTLVDVQWKELNVILKSRINKPIEGQILAKCDDLQNAVSLAKEGMKSKLWVLDKGNEFCPAKLIAYSMFHNNFIEGELIELKDVSKNGLNTIVIENGTRIGDHRAFVANVGLNTILMCHLQELNCRLLRLIEQQTSSMIRPVFLSISKVDSKMYLTGSDSLEVYSLDVSDIENNKGNETINVTMCGNKLGPSSGLETDFRRGLIYFLIRDYAIVRWSTDKPFQAEYHDVLAQSYETMPYVSRIFADSQGNIHALVNPFSALDCTRETNTTLPSERTVKIVKYNKLLDIFL